METVELNGKTYYAGLSWQTLSAAEKIKDRLKEFSVGYYTVRNIGGIINLGYSDEAVQNYKKSYSLASIVADGKKEPWMGIFYLGNGIYWHIAVRDNQAIIPGGDQTGTKDEIDRLFAEHLAIGDWDDIINDGGIKDLIKLLGDKGSYILPVKSRINYLIIFASVLFSIACVLYFYNTEKPAKPKISVNGASAANKRIVVPEYKLIPPPASLFNACRNKLLNLSASYYGWKPVKMECRGSRFDITYKRQFFATALIAPEGTMKSGDMITRNIKLVLKKHSGRYRKLLSYKKLIKVLYGYIQEFNIRAVIGGEINGMIYEPRGPRPVPPPASAPSAVPGFDGHVSIRFSNINLYELPLFFTIPSFRIISMNISGLPLKQIINVNAEVWHD